MTNALLALILVANLLIVAGFVYLWLKFIAVYSLAQRFLSPISEGELSPLATLWQALVGQFIARLTDAIKSNFLGMESGIKKQEAMLQGDLAMDDLQGKSMGLAALLGSFPSLKRRLLRNPALIDMALGLLGKRVSQPSTDHGEGTSDYKEKLAKYGGV